VNENGNTTHQDLGTTQTVLRENTKLIQDGGKSQSKTEDPKASREETTEIRARINEIENSKAIQKIKAKI
jgi:hypothetical protein